MAIRNGKRLWSTKAFVHTVRKMEHHNAVSSGIFANEFGDKLPQEWTVQAVMTLDISKMYFSHWKPPGESERMWSVNLDVSISGEYQNLGGHSCRPSE